jgi:hypothetical protein
MQPPKIARQSLSQESLAVEMLFESASEDPDGVLQVRLGSKVLLSGLFLCVVSQ